MKFYPNNIEQVLQKIRSKELRSIMLFGPDYGMISEFIKKITTVLNAEFISYESIDIENLYSQLFNKSLFDKRKVIKINVKSIKYEDSIKEALEKDNANFIVFVGSDIDTTNKFRKLYESSQKLGIIGCYPDNDKTIRSIVTSRIRSEEKQISLEAMDYLIHCLEGDRLVITNELNKLILYTKAKQQITFEDCFNCLSSSLETNPDMVCVYFAKKKVKNYLLELDILLEQQISNVWIIRALARYFQNLLIVKFHQMDGLFIDDAIKLLRPQIFFKYAPFFHEIAHEISIKEIKEVLSLLVEVEIEAKMVSDANVLNKIFINRIN